MELQFATRQAIRRAFHRQGRPIKDFRKAWNVACQKAGVPDRIPHDSDERPCIIWKEQEYHDPWR